jgi:hypothetical protein
MVNTHVKTSISSQMKSDQLLVSNFGKQRSKALQAWNKSDKPLSWADTDSAESGAYMQLLLILHDDPRSRPTELKKSRESLSYQQLAKLFSNIVRRQKAVAPVSHNGSFFHALPLSFSKIRNMVPSSENDDDSDSVVISIFSKILKKMGIHFVPWHKCERDDTRATAVQPDWWLIVKASPLAELNNSLPKEPQEVHAEVANEIMSSNPNAPWTLSTKLQDMGPLWMKYTLPTDWSLSAASLPATNPGNPVHYIKATYEYVESHFDGRIWWHHLALVWGILWSKIVPFVFSPRSPSVGPGDLNDEIRALRWLQGTSKYHGGCSNPVPFITMVSTTIFALLDSNSPLSIRATQNKNSFGKGWTTKHGLLQRHVAVCWDLIKAKPFRKQRNKCDKLDQDRCCKGQQSSCFESSKVQKKL